MKISLLFISCFFWVLLASGQENLLIDKLKIKGNGHFQDFKLKEQIIMSSHSWLSDKIFKKDPVYFSQKLYDEDIDRIRVFYQKEGYLNIDFKKPLLSQNKKGELEVTIFIIENAPVYISNIEVVVDSFSVLSDVLNKKEIKNLELKSEAFVGKIFRDEAVNQDQKLLAEVFYDKGFAYTSVHSEIEVDTAKNEASVKWLVNRGPLSYFGETTVDGNERVPEKNILHQLNYKKGEIWSKRKIDDTQKQIYNQGNYRVASVKTQLSAAKADTLPVRIHIQEAPRWTTRFGAGYGSEDKFRTFADIQYLSFLTHTGRLNFYAKYSRLEPYNIYFKFSQPSFLLPFNTLVLNPFVQRQNEPGYKLDKWGYNITFLQNFSKKLNTSIGYVFEDVNMDTSFVAKPINVTSSESIYRKAGIEFGAVYNNSEPILDPIHGYALSFNFKTNDLLFERQMPFFRILAEYKSYWGLRKGTVLALKLKMGGIQRTDDQDFIPVEERFFAGGSYSVRGWGRSELGPKDVNGKPVGGNSLMEGSAELRFDLGKLLKFSVFGDFGNVWEQSFSYHINDLHYSAGVGIRVKTPIGPAGLDFARPVFDTENRWLIHFNIGHSF